MYRKLNPSGGTPREISEVVNNLLDGKSNNTGTFNLATGGAKTTTIYDERIGFDSSIALTPTSMTAATGYYPYGAYQDDTTQSVTVTTNAYPMLFNTIDYELGISLASGSRITVGYSGLYNIQFSSQFVNTDSQAHDVSIWFRKNGTNVPKSNSEFTVPSKHGSVNGQLISALNFFIDLALNDYVEIMWATDSTTVSMNNLPAQINPTRPATPSVIVTVSHVSGDGYTTNLFNAPYVSAKLKGSATITHPANYNTDVTFDYVVVG